MTIQGKNDTRCPVCLAEFNREAVRVAGYKDCPHCHTVIPPMQIRDDGYVKMNWQDIRVLAIYAQRWAIRLDTTKKGNMHAMQALSNILGHLERYRPKDGKTHILMAHEIDPKELSKKGSIPSPYFKK